MENWCVVIGVGRKHLNLVSDVHVKDQVKMLCASESQISSNASWSHGTCAYE